MTKFPMRYPHMKFQALTCIVLSIPNNIKKCEEWTNRWMDKQAKSNMPHHLPSSWGTKKANHEHHDISVTLLLGSNEEIALDKQL